MPKDFFEQFGGRADTIQPSSDDFFRQFGGRADDSQYIKPQPTVAKAPIVNKPVVEQPVTQTKQPKAKTWFDNAKAYVIENSNQTNEQWKQMAQKALNDRAEYEQKHPIISEFQKTLQPGYAANVHKWEQEAKYGHKAPFKEKIATSLKMQRSDIAPMTNVALLPFGGEGAVWTAGKVLPVASKAKPVAEFVAKHPFIAKTIAGAPAASVEGAGFGMIDKALSDASGIETDYDYVDAAKMGALIGPAAHGGINTALAAGKGLSKTKPIQAISKAHDDLLNSDTALGNTLANIEGTISNALNLGSKNETVNKYKSLDEAIARGSVPMNKQLTPEELELIKMEQNLTDEQAWQLKHMLDNGVNSPENVADDLSHVKPETDNLTPKTEEPAVKTQPDMSGEVSEKPLLDNFQTEEQFEQLPKQQKQKVVEDNNYVIPKQEQTVPENNYFKRTKSPSAQEALANYEKNTGKKVSTIEPEEVIKLPAGKAEGSDWDNTLRVKPKAKRIGSDDLIENEDVINEFNEGLSTKLDKDGKPIKAQDKYRTDEQVEVENISKGVETQAVNDLLPDDIDSLQKEIAEYQANNKKLPRIKENKAIAEKIVNDELGIIGIGKTVKSTKLTNILKTPKMEKRVQRCLQRLFALKQSREVEKVINKIYSNAPDTHRKFIEELNNGKYTLDARKVFNSGKELKDEYVSPNVKRIDDMPSQQGFRGEDSARANMKRHGVRPKVKLASKSYDNLTELPKADKYDEWGNIKKGSVNFSYEPGPKYKSRKPTGKIVTTKLKDVINGDKDLEFLFRKFENIDVHFADVPHPEGKNGYFDHKTNSIVIYSDTQNPVRTVVHEMRHVLQKNLARNIKNNKFAKQLVKSCTRRNRELAKFTQSEKTMKIVKKIEKLYNELKAGRISEKEFKKEASHEDTLLYASYHKAYLRYRNCYLERDAREFSEGNVTKSLFRKNFYEIPRNTSKSKSRYSRFSRTMSPFGEHDRGRFYSEGNELGRISENAENIQRHLQDGDINNDSQRLAGKTATENSGYDEIGASSGDVRNSSELTRRNEREVSELNSRGTGSGNEGNKQTSSNVLTPEVQQIYDYYKKLSPETEKLKIERGAITEEQAKNRLKQQGDGSGKGLYYKDYSEPTGEAEFIEWTKDYNERRDSKVGEFGIKEKDGTKKANLKGTIKDALQEKHTKFALDLVDKHFAKPIENGKVQPGYVGVNRALLGTAIGRKYGTSWYETMLKGGDAIDKAFNETQAKGWKEYAERNNKLDYQIPKQVFDKLFDGSGETVAEYWSRYGKTHTHKAIAKTAGALLDAYNNSFKRGVLTSLSFWANNRMGNQIMLAAKSNPIEHARSVFEAFAMKDSDVPIELVESSLLEAMNDFKARKTYTGWNAFDNMLNLFGGHEIKTETLKKMVQPSKPVGVKNYVKMNGETVLEGTELKGTWKSGVAEVGNKCIALPNKVFDKVCDKLMKFNEVFERFERKQAFAIQVNKAKKQIMKTTGQKMITTEEAIKHLEAHPEMMEVVIKNVEDVLGDYNKFNNTEKKIFKRIVPFYSWYRTITRHTLSIARENPTRLALIALEMQRINERGEDRKEWQKGAFDTGLFDGRTGRKILSNKTAQIPYNTFKELFEENAKGSISPAITKPIEAARGKKFFNDSEITSRRYKRVSKYNVNSKKYEADGYLDKKTGKKVKDLPLSARAGYLGKEALQTAYPILRSPLVKAESLIQGVGKAVKDGNFLEPDAIYDADFGGYYHNEHFYGKEKRYASGQMDQGFKTANRLGLSLQTQRPLNKQERAELNKKRKEKNKRFIDRFKNS